MKTKITTLLSLICSLVFAQNKEITFDFNQGIDTELEKSGVIHTSEYNNSIKFPGESYIVFKNIKHPKELKFQYQYSINSGKIAFTIAYKKTNEASYTELKPIVFDNNPVNTSTLYDQIINIPVNDNLDIKFSVSYPDTSVGQLFLDNVKFILYSDKELSEQERMEKYLEQSSNITASQLTSVKVKDYNQKLALIKSEYVSNLSQLRTLSYRSNTLASLSKLVVFVNKRNELSNPNNYPVFNTKINFVKENCDSIYINFLTKLTEEIEPKKFIEPSTQEGKKKSGFFKVVQVLGDVGNILTGGQFKSVVNSIQNVVSTIFNPTTIKNKFPELITELTKRGKVKIFKNPNYSEEKVSKLIREGIATQKFFFDFFDILSKDKDDFNKIVSEFEYYSLKTDRLISKIDNLRDNYFNLTGNDISDAYYLNVFLDVDNKKTTDLKSKVEKYFDDLRISETKTNKSISVSNLKKIEEADELNRQIIAILKEYKTLAADLRTLFSKVEQDLNKENPFGVWENGKIVDKREKMLGNAFNSYDKLRKDAKLSFANLENNLDKILR